MFARGVEHGLRAGEIGRERFLDEYRLAETERTPRDLGLQVRRNRDGDRRDRAVIDQRPPVAEPARDADGPRQLGRASGVGARQRHHLAARVGAERRQQHGAPVVAADDSYSDHGNLSAAEARAADAAVPRPSLEGVRPAATRQIPYRGRKRETPASRAVQKG
jgi:hypothetical protein